MKVKVCGMKFKENMSKVAALGPDYMGFIFWKPSKRHFTGTADKIPNTVKRVGVFVDASIDEVLGKIDAFDLDIIQLHGKEDTMYCAQLQKELNARLLETTKTPNKGIEVIKVFSILDTFDFSILAGYEPFCNYFLFDTKGKLPGGNGYAFNWEVLNQYPSHTPFFLSGGIGPDEIEKLQEFIQSPASAHCHAIDVNSKFEIEPGIKSIDPLSTFIKTIKKF